MHAIYVNFLNQKDFMSVCFMSEHLLNLDECLQAPFVFYSSVASVVVLNAK